VIEAVEEAYLHNVDYVEVGCRLMCLAEVALLEAIEIDIVGVVPAVVAAAVVVAAVLAVKERK
jgi:hypothetical protein